MHLSRDTLWNRFNVSFSPSSVSQDEPYTICVRFVTHFPRSAGETRPANDLRGPALSSPSWWIQYGNHMTSCQIGLTTTQADEDRRKKKRHNLSRHRNCSECRGESLINSHTNITFPPEAEVRMSLPHAFRKRWWKCRTTLLSNFNRPERVPYDSEQHAKHWFYVRARSAVSENIVVPHGVWEKKQHTHTHSPKGQTNFHDLTSKPAFPVSVVFVGRADASSVAELTQKKNGGRSLTISRLPLPSYGQQKEFAFLKELGRQLVITSKQIELL